MDKASFKISGQVQADSRYVTYRAQQEADGMDVMIKLPKSSYPTVQVIKRLEKEYSILIRANHPNIVRARRMETYENSMALVMDDVKGLSLAEVMKKGLPDIASFFSIAIPLTDAVKLLHYQRIIHKNINPSNIIIDVVTGQPKLSGFSLAAELSRESQQANAREIPDADLYYISPEQTGRMNRPIDHRTDLYSLGIVFYELLTGKPPFSSDDPMEMIHSHIAKQPKPAQLLRPEIPAVISKIILRLLAKSADDRYQSTAGLLFDLVKCAEQLKQNKVPEDFPLGERDINDQFSIPDKLYGRADELSKLLDACKLAAGGRSELVLISGYSGVGKSRLVNEVKKTISQGKGYFISGKFDQFKRDIPLSSLLAAFRELILQILAESDDNISNWKKQLTTALGSNGKIITDVLPEAELLIGVQNPVPDLPPAESNNRFNRVINRFVNAFTRSGEPLCIFLDDLQWIDSATRQWMETQLTKNALGNLMLIGAYRDNEVTGSHPLMLMLERVKQHGNSFKEINLEPLDAGTLNQMIADALVTETGSCADLSQIVYQKTNGNPFFSRQCLLTLSETGAIYFDPEQHAWKYDLEKVRNADISDNVLELMSGQIQRLPETVQDSLKAASCIGSRFSLQLLNKVSGQDMESTAEQVAIAVQKGLLQPVFSWNKDEIDEYKFLHDRVQQAAYNLLEDSGKQLIRLKTGRLLFEDSKQSGSEDNIYDIADHLNYASRLIDEPAEIEVLVSVNLAASVKAKNATAYEPALKYIRQAMDLSGPASTSLTGDLELQRAECEHLNGNDSVAEGYYNNAIGNAVGILNKAKVYQRKIHYYNNLRKFNEAYQTGREAVKPLGVSLPSKFIPPLLIKDLVTYRFLLGRKKIKEIIHIREMTDENLRMAIQLMATFARAAYQIKPELCVAVCTRMVNICLRNGNTDGGFIGFLALGPIFLGAILNRKQTGYDFGELILALVEKYKSHSYKAETHFVVGYFAVPWRKPAVEMERYWQVAYEAGLETGDFFHTSCTCCGTIQSYYMRGVNFKEITNTSDRYLEFLKRINNDEAILTIMSVRQSMLNLRGKTESPVSFNSEGFDEAEYVKSLEGFQSRHFAHYYFINKMQTLYLWGEYEKAYEMALASDKYLKDSPGMLHTAEHFFYKSLIILALYPTAGTVQRMKWKKFLHKTRTTFRNYAKGCESNFIHKAQLIEAEICRVEGDHATALDFYYKAIESAAKYGYTNVHGLANAMAAAFHDAHGRRRLAGFHIQEAVYDYNNMGATAYANELIRRYPGLTDTETATHESVDGETLGVGITRSVNRGSNIDLATVMKSSEAISREIRLKDLLGRLLKIIVENAGAERMVLLLNRDEHLFVQAEYITGNEEVKILPETSVEQYNALPKPVVNYVAHSLQPVILDDATTTGNFTNEPYFTDNQTRSVLCAPLLQQGKLTGIVYLENNLTNAAFTPERIDMLILLSGQMAISIENALLYENLEDKVIERTRQLNEEKDLSDSLLLNILPAETAAELKRTGTAKAKDFEQVTVLFTDFKNFTNMSEKLNAQELVSEINYCYSAFDNIITKYGVEKIKTIGDSYMCAGGLPVEKATNPTDTVMAAIGIRDFMLAEKDRRAKEGRPFFEIRIGVHTGPVVAGIVGIKKFAYDIWGDTVNIASRMESSGQPGRINISGRTYELIQDQFVCSFRGKIEAKNKGMIDMYFVESLK